MMRLAIFVGVAAAGIWYAAVGGRQIEESHVRSLYSEYMRAFDRGDAAEACDKFDRKVAGSVRSSAPSLLASGTVDKAVVCAWVDDFYRRKKAIEEATGQEMFTNLDYTIKSIAIAPDKKSATVEILIESRIGTEEKPFFDMRSEQTDTIVRRLGSARFVHSDRVVRFYR